MKKLLFTLIFIFSLWSMLNAQWTSPGNGMTYTLDDIVALSNEALWSSGEDPEYFILADITISPTDQLYINLNDGYASLTFATDDLTLTIKGSIVAVGIDEDTPFRINHGKIRFEDATDPCLLDYCYFSGLDNIQIINSEMSFSHCEIYYFAQSSAVSCMSCDPVFTDCRFHNNRGAAIGTPLNGQSSPQILNCLFDNNVLDDDTYHVPQINLGSGGQDTIRIVGCTIDRSATIRNSGGISIANLMDTGETKILLKDNIIKKSLYGYDQEGKNISSVVEGNQMIDNNYVDIPLLYGSGINFYSTGENNRSILRNNTSSGNLWGITIVTQQGNPDATVDIDLGTENDWGYNQIHNNGNGGVVYDLYNNSPFDIMAVGNYWGTTNEQEIEDYVTHQYDDPSLGLVSYIPFSTDDAIEETGDTLIEVWPNPAQGRFTVEGKGRMTITNTLGQIILTKIIDGKETIALPQGLYLVNLNGTTQKIVVE